MFPQVSYKSDRPDELRLLLPTRNQEDKKKQEKQKLDKSRPIQQQQRQAAMKQEILRTNEGEARKRGKRK